MPVYTVHAPAIDDAGGIAADRFVFVRDGFHVWASVAGALWLAFHRLWLALLGYIAVVVALAVTLWWLRVGFDVRLVVMSVFAVLIGFEAASLQRWTLSRGKWRQVDVVVAVDREAAERRFFDRWTGLHRASADMPADRGSTPYPLSRAPGSQSHDDVMGLFPQPGALR